MSGWNHQQDLFPLYLTFNKPLIHVLSCLLTTWRRGPIINLSIFTFRGQFRFVGGPYLPDPCMLTDVTSVLTLSRGQSPTPPVSELRALLPLSESSTHSGKQFSSDAGRVNISRKIRNYDVYWVPVTKLKLSLVTWLENVIQISCLNTIRCEQ